MDQAPIVLALDVNAAKQVALALVAVLAIGALVAAAIIRSIVTKLIMVAVLAVAALVVWSQRSALQECSDRVRSAADGADVTCTFFGAEVDVPE